MEDGFDRAIFLSLPSLLNTIALTMTKKHSYSAKITRPFIKRAFPRKRLFTTLNDSRHQPVTWVSAPAGSGKTTLVTSYLETTRLPCLWYKVDCGDNDITTFFYYMGLAVKNAAPNYRKSLPLLTPEYLLGIPEFTRSYFEELYARLPHPFIIVLDDYQEVAPDSLFHEIIHTGLSIVPEGIRVIILSRNQPPPVLIRLRTGMVNTLGWNDIRFTEEESRDLISMKDQRSIDEAAFLFLHNKTKGWVAGLVLLMECSRLNNIDYQLLERFTPTDIFEYFAIEIFLKVEQATQEFLLKVAFLPVMTILMAERLTGVKNARQILSGLEKNHYFIEKRLETASVYSFHPLFKEFLKARALKTLASDQVERLQYDAASLLMEADYTEDAARLLLEARDMHRFVILVLDQARSFIDQGRVKTLNNWLEAIPKEIAEDNPWLLYWLAISRVGLDPGADHLSFSKAFQLFEARGDLAGAMLAWSGVVNTLFSNFEDSKKMDLWIKWLEIKMSQGTTFPSRDIEMSVSTSMILALYHRKPEHPDLKNWVKKTLTLSLKGTHFESCLPTIPFFVYYYISSGEFDACTITVNEMRRMIRTQTASPLLLITLKLAEALLYSTSPDLHEEGIKAVSAGLDLAGKTGAHFLDPLLFGAGVHNSLNAADVVTACEYLDKMEIILKYGKPGHSSYFLFLAGWCALSGGNEARALTLAQKSTQLAEELGLVYPAGDCRTLLLFVLLETGDFLEAKKQLEAIKTYALQTQSHLLKYRYNLLAAYFAFRENDREGGMVHLIEGMSTGRHRGFTTMVNFWRPAIMSSLCATALQAGVEVDYVHDLIRKLKLQPSTSAIDVENWPWPVWIRTMGRFEILKDGKLLKFKVKAPHKILLLLKALIACGQGGIREDRLAEMLWPDAEGDAAHKTLEISLSRLRKLLGGNQVIRLSQGHITLESNCCRVDAHAFTEIVDCAEEIFRGTLGQQNAEPEKIAEDVRILERATGLYHGGFVDGLTEPWALTYREQLKDRFIRAVTLLGDYYEARKKYEDAMSLYGKAIEIEDEVESLYRGLMRCHLALEHRSEAVAVYRRCQRKMLSVFGVGPSHEMDVLFKSIESI